MKELDMNELCRCGHKRLDHGVTSNWKPGQDVSNDGACGYCKCEQFIGPIN
jgi:hypothetical protein